MTDARGERGGNRRSRKKGRPGKRPNRHTSQRPPWSSRARRRKQRVLAKAVAHPVRRRMLRAIDDEGAPLSPARLAKDFDLPLGLAVYHADVLQRCGVVERSPAEDG